jgi:hypothetical protein
MKNFCVKCTFLLFGYIAFDNAPVSKRKLGYVKGVNRVKGSSIYFLYIYSSKNFQHE